MVHGTEFLCTGLLFSGAKVMLFIEVGIKNIAKMLIFRRFRNQTNKSEHIRTKSSETIRTYPN